MSFDCAHSRHLYVFLPNIQLTNTNVLSSFIYPRQKVRSPIVTFLWRMFNTLFNPWAKAHGYKHATPTG